MPTTSEQQTTAQTLLKKKTSILKRAARYFLLLALLIVLALSLTSFLVARALMQQQVLSQLHIVASSTEDILEENLRSVRERSSLLASNGAIQRLVAQRHAKDIALWIADVRKTQPSLISMGVSDASGSLLSQDKETRWVRTRAIATEILPVIDEYGWRWYDVIAPIHKPAGGIGGFLLLRYEVSTLAPSFDTSLSSLGHNAQVFIAMSDKHGLRILHNDPVPQDELHWVPYTSTSQKLVELLQQSVAGDEGVKRLPRDGERASLVAYRNLPTLGWGAAIQVREADVMSGVRWLGMTLGLIGAWLLVFATFLAFLLARELTNPIRALTEKVRVLKPGEWGFARTVKTGDEVEMLDGVINDMAERLKRTYDYLEEEIQTRTKELRQQYALDRAILEGIDYGVLTVDTHGRIHSANPAALHILKLDWNDVAGKQATQLLPVCIGQECKSFTLHPVDQCLQRGQPYRPAPNENINMTRPDRSIVAIDLLVSPLLPEGTLQGAVIVFADVSEERRVEAMKSEFISLASHQLRTPLSIVRWYIDLLSEDGKGLTNDQKSYLEEMGQAINRMVGLLNALLQVARLEGGGLSVDLQKVDIRAIADETIAEMHVLAKKKEIHCSVEAPEGPMHAFTDPALLKVVLQNLVQNGIKYGKKSGSVSVALAATGSTLRVSVTDDGVGIPEGEQKNIFQKFYRAKNVKQFDTDGNGLGLYMCRMIVEGLRGRIAFVSEEQKGTTFTIDLPRNAAEEVAPLFSATPVSTAPKKKAKRKVTKKAASKKKKK